MKSTFFVIVMLLLVTIPFLQNSFAQNLSDEMTVRVIYFLPWQQPPDPTVNTRFDNMVKDVQTLFADQMERHGYGRKTFTLETDAQGKTKVHRVDGQLDDKNYLQYTWKVWQEIRSQFDLSKNVYLVLIQISSEVLSGGRACGLGTGGSVSGGGLVPSSGHCFTKEIVAHELGHAFGLMHDFHNDRYIMSYGWGGRNTVSPCHAEWLNDHRAFNPGKTSTSETVGVQHLSTSLAAPPNKISLRFEMTHRDGLQHAQLTAFPVAREENPRNLKILTCEHVEGRRDIVEFVTDELTPSAAEVMLNVMDVHGNISRQWIPIRVGNLFTTSSPVSIADNNLAAAIRETLRLSPTSPITELDMLKLKSLNAYKRGITNLNGIQYARNLKYLRVWENQIRDITPLTELPQLTTLDISRNQVTDIRQLAGSTNLTDLWLSGNPIRDITPIAGLTELLELGLSDLQITDIRWLRDFTYLKSLYLSNNQIRDITPLAQLTELTNLNISGNQITDIRHLARLTDLEDLWISNNQISNITPLAQLIELAYLGISSNQIQDIRPLMGLVNLERLWMEWNQVEDVSPLARLVQLEELWINGNPIQDTSPLAKLKTTKIDIDIETYRPRTTRTTTRMDPIVKTVEEPTDGNAKVSILDPNLAAAVRKALDLGKNAPITKKALWKLTSLDARESQIKNLNGLEHATQLEFLELRDNQIRGIWPLTQLKNLDTLVLDSNKVRNIKPLEDMTQLTWLLIGDNPVADVTPIANLTELRGLGLWSNNVKNVSLLAGMTELTHLWLGGNKISNIKPLAKLTKLKVLSLRDNKIRDISPLAGLKKLEELTLRGNPVKDLSPLASLPKLSDVDVQIPGLGVPTTGTWFFIHKPANLTTDNFTIGPGEFAILVHQGKQNAVKKADFKTYASYWTPDGKTDFPNLQHFFRNGGRIEIVSHASLNPLPPNTKEPQFKDIVISEIMWGLNGASSAKQYIELYNASEHTYTFANGDLSLRFSKVSEAPLPDSVFPFPPNPNAHNKVVDRVSNKGWKVRGKGGNTRKNKPLISMYRSINYTSGFVPNGTVARSWRASQGRVNLPAPSLGTPGAKHTSSGNFAAAPLNSSTAIPDATDLLANYPNPFNPETWLPYHLAENTDVKINIYDAQGALVRVLTVGHQAAGYYTSRSRAAYWDGRNALGERVASGIYFYRLQTDEMSPMRKMVILK